MNNCSYVSRKRTRPLQKQKNRKTSGRDCAEISIDFFYKIGYDRLKHMNDCSYIERDFQKRKEKTMRNISEKQSIEEVEVCEGNHQLYLVRKCVYVISAICLAFPSRRYLTSFACFVQAIWLKTAGKENRFSTRWTMNTLLPF